MQKLGKKSSRIPGDSSIERSLLRGSASVSRVSTEVKKGGREAQNCSIDDG